MLSILLVSGNQNLASLPIFFQKPDGSGDGSVEPPNNNRVFSVLLDRYDGPQKAVDNGQRSRRIHVQMHDPCTVPDPKTRSRKQASGGGSETQRCPV